MSHWVTYTNDVLTDTDMSTFETAVSQMGLGVDHKIKRVSNAYGDAAVDFALTRNGSPLSIGFKICQNGTHRKLELRGDFFVTGLNQSKFMDELAQKYQSVRIQNILVHNNWSIESTTVNNNDEIIIDAYEYVLA